MLPFSSHVIPLRDGFSNIFDSAGARDLQGFNESTTTQFFYILYAHSIHILASTPIARMGLSSCAKMRRTKRHWLPRLLRL